MADEQDEALRLRLFFEGITNATTFNVDGVRFDFRELANVPSILKGAEIDVPSMHSLTVYDHSFSYFYPPIYPDPVDDFFGDVVAWPSIQYPWQRLLSRAEMLSELEELYKDPEIFQSCASLLFGAFRTPAELAMAWLAHAESLLVQVRRGDSIRAVWRADVVLTDDPFEFEADQTYTAVTLEHWRRGTVQSSAVSGLCFRQPASLFAPGAEFLEVIRDRVLARSNVRRPFRYDSNAGGNASWDEEYPEPSSWDRAASAWFVGLKAIRVGAEIEPPLDSEEEALYTQMVHQQAWTIFEAGARFGWLSKQAENSQSMQAEALQQWKRRAFGRVGGHVSGQLRRDKAKALEKVFQEHADSIWDRHPTWSKSRVALEVAKITGKRFNTIRQTIRKS